MSRCISLIENGDIPALGCHLFSPTSWQRNLIDFHQLHSWRFFFTVGYCMARTSGKGVNALGSHNFIVWFTSPRTIFFRDELLNFLKECIVGRWYMFFLRHHMLPPKKNGENGPVTVPFKTPSKRERRESPKPFSFRMLFVSFREGMPPRYCFTASQGRAAEWTWAFFACFASVAGEKSVMGVFFSLGIDD